MVVMKFLEYEGSCIEDIIQTLREHKDDLDDVLVIGFKGEYLYLVADTCLFEEQAELVIQEVVDKYLDTN